MADLHPDLQALIGSVIHERYRVDGLLGQGGMGAVFRGRHLGLARDVAIKVLRPELGRSDATAKRFDREAHSVSRLDHPNCVRVTDFGTTDGGVKYLVMELLEGAELEDSLGQPWAPAQAIDTITQILEGLEHAHHFGIVHRDLKPENVFVTADFRGREVVKLVDFGIAKLLDDQDSKEQLTRAGMVFGTPRYMSPEQASGGKLDARTDLYAAGLILYEMLSGHPPFAADEAAILLRMHILAPPPPLPPSVPAALAEIVDKLLAKSRNDRYASAREAVTALAGVRPQLAQAVAASPGPTPVATGPVATPSMATQFEATPSNAGTGWNPAAPPGASAPMPAPRPPVGGPLAAPPGLPAMPPARPAQPGVPAPGPLASPPGLPAMPPSRPAQPGMPMPASPPSSAPLPVVPTPGWTDGASLAPNTATQAPHGSDPSGAITSYTQIVAQPRPAKPARPWLPWAITGGAIMLALMAFGAGQALQPHGPAADQARAAAEPKPAAAAANGGSPSLALQPAPAPAPVEIFDEQCTNQDRCELSCGEGCSARCADAGRCEIAVGPESRVVCERVGKCEVSCTGDCRVQCPQGGCEVRCPHPSGKRRKKPKSAKKCGDTYVCGGDCDDDDDDDD